MSLDRDHEAPQYFLDLFQSLQIDVCFVAERNCKRKRDRKGDQLVYGVGFNFTLQPVTPHKTMFALPPRQIRTCQLVGRLECVDGGKRRTTLSFVAFSHLIDTVYQLKQFLLQSR